VCDQLALSQYLDEILVHHHLGHLSQVARIQIVLGKHTPQLNNVNMEGIFTIAARLCHEANTVMTKQPS